MMKKILAAVICALLALSLSFPSNADYRSEAEEIIAHKTAASGAKSTREWISSLAETAGVSAEWYVIALSKLGYSGFGEYSQALADYLSEKTMRGTNSQRCALAFIASGVNSTYIESTARESIGSQGIMSYIWGLLLLSCGADGAQQAPAELAREIAMLRKQDGGFALSGESSNADVTAMAITALAPYRDDADVAAAIESSLAFLSSAQTASGGFMSYGEENCESAAQVVIALCTLGIDPESDTRFIKNGNSALDSVRSFSLGGGYAHTAGGAESEMATVQALHAFTAMHLLSVGDSLFAFDAPSGVPAGFLDVGAPRGGEANESTLSIKNTVCIAIIAACAVGIAVTACIPSKKTDE
jgi:hypothetical protein